MAFFRNCDIMLNLTFFFSFIILLVYPFLTYGIIVWGNTYESSLKSLVLLPKRSSSAYNHFLRYDEHTSPLFENLDLLKLFDIIKISNLLFMHAFYTNNLPTVFNDFFFFVSDRHKNSTIMAKKLIIVCQL